MIEKNFPFIKRGLRWTLWILWIIFGLLNILDIITTFIGGQIGGYEHSPILSPYLGNPIILIGIKIVYFILPLVCIEFVIFVINKIPYNETYTDFEKLIYYAFYCTVYATCIVFLILFILFYLIVQDNNIQFILFHHSFL